MCGVWKEPWYQSLSLLIHWIAPFLLALGVDSRTLANGIVANLVASVARISVIVKQPFSILPIGQRDSFVGKVPPIGSGPFWNVLESGLLESAHVLANVVIAEVNELTLGHLLAFA